MTTNVCDNEPSTAVLDESNSGSSPRDDAAQKANTVYASSSSDDNESSDHESSIITSDSGDFHGEIDVEIERESPTRPSSMSVYR